MTYRYRPALIALLILSAVSSSFADRVAIIYWGDRMAADLPRYTSPTDTFGIGGAWQLAGVIDSLKKEIPATFVVSAGGDLAGTPAAIESQGSIPARILHEIGPDVFVPGIVDFSYGAEALREVIDDEELPAITANLYGENPRFSLRRDTIVSVGGIRGAFTGIASRRIKQLVRLPLLGDLILLDPVPIVKQFVNKRHFSTEFTVAISQTGWSLDSAFAAEAPDLDVVIEGHSLTGYDPPRRIGRTTILAAPPSGEVVGRAIFDFDQSTRRLTYISNQFIPVKSSLTGRVVELKWLVNKKEKPFQTDRGKRVSTLVTDWNVNPNGPSNLPQWVADLLRRTSNAAQVGLVVNTELKKDIPAGELYERDLEEIYPFDTPIIVTQIKGRELIGAIEYGLSIGPSYLTWSGIEVVVEGGRVSSLTLRGQPVYADDEYALMITGQTWDRFRNYTGLEPGYRQVYLFPDPQEAGRSWNLREFLLTEARKQTMISTPIDDRLKVK